MERRNPQTAPKRDDFLPESPDIPGSFLYILFPVAAACATLPSRPLFSGRCNVAAEVSHSQTVRHFVRGLAVLFYNDNNKLL